MPPQILMPRQSGSATIDYLEARDLQLALVEKVHSGQQPNTLLLLEHPHVYTRAV